MPASAELPVFRLGQAWIALPFIASLLRDGGVARLSLAEGGNGQ